MSFRNINSNFLFTNYHKPNHKKIVLKKKLTLLNQNKILHINAEKPIKTPNKWIILLTTVVTSAVFSQGKRPMLTSGYKSTPSISWIS